MVKKYTLWSIPCVIVTLILSMLFIIVPQKGVLPVNKAHAAGNKPILFPENPYDGCTYEDLCSFGGSYFGATEKVHLFVDYNAPMGPTEVATTTTDSSGSFQVTIKTPSIPYQSNILLVARGIVSKLSASASLGEAPVSYSNPTIGTIGTKVSVKSGDLGSNENVEISYRGQIMTTAMSNSIGVVVAAFVIPKGSRLGGSNMDIVIKGLSTDITSYASFAVIPGINITPSQGPSGTRIVVKANNLSPSTDEIIDWYDPNTKTDLYITNLNATSQGTISTIITAPGGLVAGYTYYVRVQDANGGNQAKFIAS